MFLPEKYREIADIVAKHNDCLYEQFAYQNKGYFGLVWYSSKEFESFKKKDIDDIGNYYIPYKENEYGNEEVFKAKCSLAAKTVNKNIRT